MGRGQADAPWPQGREADALPYARGPCAGSGRAVCWGCLAQSAQLRDTRLMESVVACDEIRATVSKVATGFSAPTAQ